jgi:ribosomal protein S6--L-glutamate ligase
LGPGQALTVLHIYSTMLHSNKGTGTDRKMLIGILTVRSHRYHPNKRLLEAAHNLGHEATLIHPGKFYMGVDHRGLIIEGVTNDRLPDVILPRIGATIKEYGLTMVRHFHLMGIPAVNHFESILLARNKFLTTQTLALEGIPVPETRYASNWRNFHEALSTLGSLPVVIKLSSSRQGSGVFLLESLVKSRSLLEKHLGMGEGLLLQRYISPEKRRDLRILVVAERIVGAMSLRPRKGDFRSNIHRGGKAEVATVTEGMSSLAIASTRALGLDISGVDMIENEDGTLRVVEVNYSPGFKGLEKVTGKDVASEILKCVVRVKERAYGNSLCHG